MLSGFRSLLLVAYCGAALVGCGGSSSGERDAFNKLVVSPSSPVVKAKLNGGTQTLDIVFTSSNAQSITDLRIDGLDNLPADWSSVASFACSTVTIGNGCVLRLSYTPLDSAHGTLALTYSYRNSAGTTANGSIAVPYSGTAENNVVATMAPAGQVIGIVGQPRTVAVTFVTDDGRAASALQLITDTLPAGWAAASTTLPCTILDNSHPCELKLEYSPSVVTPTSALVLDYEYQSEYGTVKTGTMNISYAATVNNNVVVDASAASLNVGISVSSQTTLTFNTDDGYPASDFEITSTLPADWSGPALNCSSVSTGNGCQVTFTYTPTVVQNGTLNVDYRYIDNSGQVKTGSFNVPYRGRTLHAYAPTGSGLFYCTVDITGDLSGCQPTTVFMNIHGIALHDGHAFLADFVNETITRCTVDAGGDLPSCDPMPITSGNPVPWRLEVAANRLYVSNFRVGLRTSFCAFSSAGGLGPCAETGAPTTIASVAFSGRFAYLATFTADGVYACHVDAATGELSACTPTASGIAFTQSVAAGNGFVYINDHNSNLFSCVADATTGELSSCIFATGLPDPNDLEIFGTHALLTQSVGVQACDVDTATGALVNCRQSNAGLPNAGVGQISVF